jgi:hypothetical protein
MAGRKPIYDTESLEIGGKLRLSDGVKLYRYQYVRTFNNRSNKKFALRTEGKKLFVERIA